MRRRSAPVKAPFSWPNSSDLEQVLRDRGAVEGEERGLGPGAVLVDGQGDQFFPGPALAGDQDGHVLGGDAADGLVHLEHGRAGADDGAVHVRVRGGLGDHGRLAHPPGHLQRLADHPPQVVRVERLEEVVVGTLPHRLDGCVCGLRHGHEDDRDARVDPADLLVDVQAGLVGQAQIEENNVRRHGTDPLEPFGAGASHFDPVSGPGEHLAHQLRDQCRVIIDEQQVGHDALALGVPGRGPKSLAGPLWHSIRCWDGRLNSVTRDVSRVQCNRGVLTMTEPSGYDLETLWEDGEFVLSRGVREGEPSPLLAVAPASAQPSPGSLARLEHAYALRDELDSAWAARPLRLVRDRGRPTLVLEDPGGEPLARLMGQPWEITSFLRVAIGLATALGSAPRAGPHPQGRQAGPRPRQRRDRRRLADGLRHRVPPAARAPGPRAARGDRRDARLHGAGADRSHEPFGRFPQRSVLAWASPSTRCSRGRCPSPLPIRWSGSIATSPGSRRRPASGPRGSPGRSRRS